MRPHQSSSLLHGTPQPRALQIVQWEAHQQSCHCPLGQKASWHFFSTAVLTAELGMCATLEKGILHFLLTARNCQLLRPDYCEVWMPIQSLQAKTFISSALCPTSLPFVPRLLFPMGTWKWLTSAPHEMGGGTGPARLLFLLCLQLATCTTVFWLPLSCQE